MMSQRRNRRSGVEDRWTGRDGQPTKVSGVGKRWRARYVDLAGREHAQSFGRKVDAERWLNEVTTSIVTGTYVDPKLSRTLVGVVAEDWYLTKASVTWKETTKLRNRAILDDYVLPRWGSTELVNVHPADIASWVSQLNDGSRAPSTVHKIAWTLAGVLTYAVAKRRLGTSPFVDIDLPRKVTAKRVYLTAAQVEALAEGAGEQAPIVLTLAYCGLRIGELAALTVADLDVGRRRLYVHRSVTEVNGRLVWSTPKDGEGRQVPAPRFLVELLGERSGEPGDLLFPSTNGSVLRVRNMRRDWFDAAAQMVAPGLTPHGLRHTAASLAISAGGTVLAVQQMLGHDKPSTTLDIYSDLFDRDGDDLADRLDAARARTTADALRTELRIVR